MSERPTMVRYETLAWLTIAAALSYLCRNAVSVAESTIRKDLNLSLVQSGWFMGSFFWTYAVFQIPGGWTAQHFGTRVTLTGFALAWSVATLGIGLAPGFWLLIAAQLLMGIAQAGIFPASCNSIGHWMPMSQRSLACGILAAGMQVGAIVASGVTADLINWKRSPLTFVFLAVPGMIWAVRFFFRFQDRPEQVDRVNAAELLLIQSGKERPAAHGISMQTELQSWRVLLSSPLIWFLCGQQIARAAGYMFFASWFPSYLQETRGVSVKESGYLQGLVLTGTLVGSVFGGLLTDWIWRRTGSLRLSRSGVGGTFLAGCSVLTLSAWFVESAHAAVALLALGAFFAALAGPCALAATIDMGGSRVPQVFGLMNMMGNLAAALCPVLVGELFAWTANWNLVLILFAGVYMAGALCWVFVHPQRRLAID